MVVVEQVLLLQVDQVVQEVEVEVQDQHLQEEQVLLVKELHPPFLRRSKRLYAHTMQAAHAGYVQTSVPIADRPYAAQYLHADTTHLQTYPHLGTRWDDGRIPANRKMKSREAFHHTGVLDLRYSLQSVSDTAIVVHRGQAL